MSATLTLPDTDFTDAERTDIRRFCGYPAYGGSATATGWRYFQQYGALEYRMSNMSPAERQVTRMLLATLASFETDLASSSANLDTAMAASWRHNPNEVADRFRLMSAWGQRLAAHFGVPFLGDARASNIVI
ncbi:hypothetical protein FHR90_002849 [Endobacter medicaginis]|jgi:hypothetical protein|uniref:Uncharacterized protein n=1 Tax=Endobacter medicaginis TaxID=1181271 RepID=A0A839V620_9PROT|nr:hypothetical protein [Endobacter medicaginis]MBB3175002.1 hypothetical protein [Endobacter medicaginis]MCX5475924.1 hypothetical protein [Endobacter medicaginis]NVN28852.1 hypothetical protein [Endobacter medicaginis]